MLDTPLHTDVHRLLERMYDALDRGELSRKELSEITDHLSDRIEAICKVSALPGGNIEGPFAGCKLTPTELKIALHLHRNLGNTTSKRDLLNLTRTYMVGDDARTTRLIGVWITLIRKKISDMPWEIDLDWGNGYRMVQREQAKYERNERNVVAGEKSGAARRARRLARILEAVA